jgi:sugar phosphate isomerase/epimerase
LSGVHADFANDAASGPVLDLYARHGIRIVSIGVQGLAANRAVERKFFEFVKRAGARCMSVDFNLAQVPEAYRVAEELAAEFGVDLGIHNHGGRHWLGSAQQLSHVFGCTSERIGLCLDTAWALDAGEDPVSLADRFAKRLFGLHFKDFVFDRARKHQDVVVGTGNLDLPKLLAVLRKNAFGGCAVIEYEADPDNPAPAVGKCVQAIRAAWNALPA